MNERCSAVLLNKLPLKEKVPLSFTIPCDIGDLHIDNALADLGASISLMPYSMYEKLGLGEPKPTRMSLELGDRSIQYPRGIAKNVLIKVDKFFLPIDFVILDMREDTRIPIILGRPFLATVQAMIDVFNKKITLRIGDEEVIFDVDQSINKPLTEDDECYGVDDLDQTIHLEAQELIENDHTNSFLLKDLDKTQEFEKTLNEYLCSASANEIDEKIPELKDLPSHLEYAYLNEDRACPVLLLQGFNIEIKDKKGAENLAADHLSRLENPNMGILTEKEIADEFPDEHLMVLKTTPDNDEPWLCPDNIMRRCITGDEIADIISHCHSRPTRGHHSASITGRKVYEFRFFWPSIFRDAKDYVSKCDACQKSGPFPDSRVEITDENNFIFKVNGHRLKKYYGGPINTEENKVVELHEAKRLAKARIARTSSNFYAGPCCKRNRL
ncbi:reverse transcriptase domain-containing protein [Tanacetum coccineum]